MSEKGKTVDWMLGLFRMYCFVSCGCKGEDHGHGRCLNCSGCTAVSEKGKTVDWMLGLFRMYCFVSCGCKGEDRGLDAWTVQDVLLCQLWM